MNETTETLAETIARLEAETAKLKAQRDAAIAAERPTALAKVGELIRKHAFTRDDLDPFVRKRPKKERGPRKPKTASTPPPNGTVTAMPAAHAQAVTMMKVSA